ncbi:MAG: hypothetical protein D3916_07835 [Candidatus Electrothrix sp. MAN1_4]|nr:hypothetical protein [Candidatus Electrothrix sp. MAN1_4]
MYPTISIQNHKGVSAQELNHLGKINILCGPNSSGKSSVLEAITGSGKDPLQKKIDTYSNNRISVKMIPSQRILSAQGDWKLSARRLSDTGECLLPHLFFCRNQKENSVERIYYDKLHKAFRQVTCGYNFDIHISKEKSSRSHFDELSEIKLSFKSPDDGVIRSAKNFGLGLHEILVILAVSTWGEEKVICLEEPETHVHPDMQRRLLSFFRNDLDKQFFISTHSSIFIQPSVTDRVFYTNYKDGSVHIDDITSKAAILHNLGYSVTDNLVSDLVILVEGPTDVPVIEEFLEKHGILQHHVIKIWPLGGDIMDKHDLTVFSEKYKLLVLVDQDPGSSSVRNRFLKNCEDLKIKITKLSRYAIENYFTLDALRSVFNNQISSDISQISPDKPLKEQIHIDVKKNNRKIARAMSLKDIDKTDLGDFFLCINSMLEER